MSNFHFDISLKLPQGEVHDFSGEVQKFSGEVQNDLRGGARLCAPVGTPPLKIRPCHNYNTSFLT
jgi:threonine dehydrogenase-like Zn-dependent dehydrogenase